MMIKPMSSLLLLAGAGLGLAAALLARKRRLYEHKRGEILLKLSPNALKGLDMVCLAIGILAKYVPGTVGYRTTFTKDLKMPSIDVHGTLRLENADLRRFSAAIDGQRGDNPMFLIAVTAPLIIFILSLQDCPVKPLGAVNTRNVFHFLRPEVCGNAEALLQASRQGKLRYRASFGGEARPGIRRKRGMEFSIHIDVFDGQDTPLLKQELYFLQFLKSSVQPVYDGNPAMEDDDAPAETKDPFTTELQKLHIRSPRSWAASCGDYNPIHISVLAAKLFGFPSVIAHGNHVVALALSKPSPAVERLLKAGKSYTLDVRFVKPMILPAQLRTTWSERQSPRSSHTLRIFNCREKDHILGTLG